MKSNNTQVPHQTQQSLAATNQIDEFVNSQGWPVTVGSNNDQGLVNEVTPVTSNSIEEFLGGIQDSSVMVEGKHDQPPVASDIVGDTIYGQDSSVMVRSIYNEILGIQDHLLPPVTVGSNSNRNQVLQTAQYPVASYSGKEIINIPDSPVKKKFKYDDSNGDVI